MEVISHVNHVLNRHSRIDKRQFLCRFSKDSKYYVILLKSCYIIEKFLFHDLFLKEWIEMYKEMLNAFVSFPLPRSPFITIGPTPSFRPAQNTKSFAHHENHQHMLFFYFDEEVDLSHYNLIEILIWLLCGSDLSV